MTRLTLIRHGETEWNRKRLIQGTTDIPLNGTGRRQAAETARRLRSALSDPASARLVSSDLSRARETAQIIADTWECPAPLVHSGLRERAYGEAEGMSIEDFANRWGDWYTAQVPGAESRADLEARALAALGEAVASARATEPAHSHVIVVTHGALIRSVLHHVSEGRLPARDERLANGSDYTFEFSAERLTLVEYAGVVIGG